MLGNALRNGRVMAAQAVRGQVRNMSMAKQLEGVKDVKVKDTVRFFSDKMKDPAAQAAAKSGYAQYHEQIIKKGDWSPVLHCIAFMWCIGYANDYRSHLQYEKQQQGGPEIIWPH